MKLSYKLFGAFFLILALVTGAMAVSRYLFYTNLKAYILQEEMDKLEDLVPVLGEAYRKQGSWEGVTANPRRWRALLRSTPERGKRVEGVFSIERFKGKRGRRHGRMINASLLDAGGKVIIGTSGPADPRYRVPIPVDGRTVGFLGLNTRENFKSGPPAAVLEQHTRHLYLLGGAVIGLTVLIAFFFSRHLLVPIRRLTRGTRELAGRNFNVRIPVSTRDELGQLAANFNETAQTLERYEKMRRQWLTDISHELRTPISILRGEIEALQDGVRHATTENLASLHSEILRLGKLVEDLHFLSLAEADSFFLDRQRIDPTIVLRSIVDRHAHQFTRQSLLVELSLGDIEGRTITGDADRLAQVFTNLLDNACKYVRSPGRLKISGEAGANELVLRFDDSGPGVPDEALPRIFDRLYRLDPSRNRDTGGSGIGLAICLHIIEQHGGRIWAEKNAMGGLSILIKLPFKE